MGDDDRDLKLNLCQRQNLLPPPVCKLLQMGAKLCVTVRQCNSVAKSVQNCFLVSVCNLQSSIVGPCRLQSLMDGNALISGKANYLTVRLNAFHSLLDLFSFGIFFPCEFFVCLSFGRDCNVSKDAFTNWWINVECCLVLSPDGAIQ